MTLGRLASTDINAGINTLIYTVPERSVKFSCTLNICNRNDSDVLIRFAIVDGVLADLVDADWIEYNVLVRAGGLIERSELDMKRGQSIIGYSDKSNVSFAVWA